MKKALWKVIVRAFLVVFAGEGGLEPDEGGLEPDEGGLEPDEGGLEPDCD